MLTIIILSLLSSAMAYPLALFNTQSSNDNAIQSITLQPRRFRFSEPSRNKIIPVNYHIKDEFPQYVPPGKRESRSPCPMLNTLANHNIIHHDGRNITKTDLRKALVDFLKTSEGLADVLIRPVDQIGYVNDNGENALDLHLLQRHGFIEHDVSLSRQDVELGNNTVFDKSVYDDIYYFTEPSDIDGRSLLPLSGLAGFRNHRYQRCKDAHNLIKKPAHWNLPVKDALTGLLEASLAYLEFRDKEFDDKIRMDWFDEFFVHERFPFNLGWRSREVDMTAIAWTTAKLKLHSVFQ